MPPRRRACSRSARRAIHSPPMKAAPALIRVNRAPVLTLWATVVAERLGYPPETALTLGRFVAWSSARAKARRLGINDEKQDAEERHAHAAELRPRRLDLARISHTLAGAGSVLVAPAGFRTLLLMYSIGRIRTRYWRRRGEKPVGATTPFAIILYGNSMRNAGQDGHPHRKGRFELPRNWGPSAHPNRRRFSCVGRPRNRP